jgi:hypothetical protein
MSRLGDLENAIVARLAAATIAGAPVFATVKGFSGGYRPVLRDAIRRERLPAAFVAFTEEAGAPETNPVKFGAQFSIIVAAQMLRTGANPRLGDATALGAFTLMDKVREQLDDYEPVAEILLYRLQERFVESDDRVAVYEATYRAWPTDTPLLLPEDPLFGPRTIGSVVDYVTFDPAVGEYTLAGAARPIRRLPVVGPALAPYVVGIVTATRLSTNADSAIDLPAVQVTAANDGGWRSLPFVIDEGFDVGDSATIIVPVQAVASASGNVSLRADWDRARDGASGVSESSAASTFAGPTTAGAIAYATAGTIPAGTFAVGDVAALSIQRLGSSDTNDTYTQDLLIARFAYIVYKRNKL